MTTATTAPPPYRSTVPESRRAGFGGLLRAEWTKLWSVRRWTLALPTAILLTIVVALLSAAGGSAVKAGGGGGGGGGGKRPPGTVHPFNDGGGFVHRPLAGDGTVTARVTAQRASHPEAKAGLMIRRDGRRGAPYAVIAVTPGRGVRLRSGVGTDLGGGSGPVPRWLRLTRSGTSVTGYASSDGAAWRRVGTVEVAGLSGAAQAGPYVGSPSAIKVERRFGGESTSEVPTEGSATFDRVDVAPAGGARPAPWVRRDRETGADAPLDPADSPRAGAPFTLAGSGDVGPDEFARDITETALAGVLIGLMAVVALAVLSVTSEYRRGMIRTTFAATPARGRVLAAKALVLGAAAFAAGLAAAAGALLISFPVMRGKGLAPPPVTEWPVLRAVLGTALLLALIAVLSVGVAVILRHAAASITVLLLVLLVPQIVATGLPLSAATWLERLSPAAGFAMQQTVPRYDTALGPWAGLGVLAAYTAAVLAAALWLLRRRDA
ncbi:ABC transporter permease subunit [Spirillospora sp. NBC_01491]|uniref:ABC transporter permease subunit n=1 Tax=Spirillospora sp. NBC_01491 TaxID=2976007 RepID=UPI002E317E43|nr:ABC transporter permease subunit [Spirillospora sp. NBC_01491]